MVKVVKYSRTTQLNDLCRHNCYLIYDHHHRKFYILQLASSYRYIAVAEDLHEMYHLLNSHAKDKGADQAAPNDLRELSEQALKSLEMIGRGRFNMP